MKKRVLKMQTKLVLFVLFAAIMPFLLLAILLFLRQMELTKQDIIANAQGELHQTAARMGVELSQFTAISNLFYLDGDLTTAMNRYNAGLTGPAGLRDAVYPLTQRYNAGMPGRSFTVAVVLLDGSLVGNAFYIDGADRLDVRERPWFSQLQLGQTRAVWTTDSALDDIFSPLGRPGIYLIRQLHLQEDWSPVGTLILCMSDQEVRRLVSNYTTPHQNIYLLDGDHRVISYEDNLGLGTLPIDRSTPMESYDGSEVWNGAAGQYLTAYETVSATQWTVVTCSSFSALLADFHRSIGYYISLSLSYLCIVCILVYFFTWRYLRPVKLLHANMALVQRGDLDVRVPVSTRDEIGELTEQFNAMVAETGRLIDQVRLGEEKKREAEIDALQSQINPHFLYNTLASIRYMIQVGEKQKADKVVLSLIRLMRNVLSDSREYVSVRSECDLLMEYINIQQLVLEGQLDAVVDIQEEVLHCRTIKLLLQPLVENAIQHGLKPSSRHRSLRVTGRVEAGDIIAFTVEDNGVGFDCPPDFLERCPIPQQHGIGLFNVHSRIRLNFGEAYGLSVESAVGTGTTVTVRVPKLEENGVYSTYEHSDR